MAKTKRKNSKINYEKAWYALAISRIALGTVFLWAFLDKLLGLGVATPAKNAWLLGGSPTTGFLSKVKGPFADLFNGMAGNPFLDWLFMLGLLGIGLALILGIGLRVAAVAGTALLVMMWAASLPIKTHPFLDEHLIYALVLWVYALGVRKWSLIDTWLRTDYVKKHAWLW